MTDDRIMIAMKAVLANSHLAQAKAMRDRAEFRKLSGAAAEVIWFQIHALEAAAKELIESAIEDGKA